MKNAFNILRYLTLISKARGLVLCRNILFIRSMMCLLVGCRAETIFSDGPACAIGLSAPTTMSRTSIAVPHNLVTSKNSNPEVLVEPLDLQ